MPHIHTEPGQYDHTVSLYVFRTDFDEPKVMLHFHRKVKAYAQFGGHIELHEHPWQAAIHELREESGYALDQIELLQPKDRMMHMSTATIHPYPVVHATMTYPAVAHSHTDSAYAVVAHEAPRYSPEEGESTDIRLFTRAEVTSSAEIDAVTREISLYIFDHCLSNWQPIPPSEFK